MNRATALPGIVFKAMALLLGLTVSAGASDWAPRQGLELIGQPAPELQGIKWLQGGPLSLAEAKSQGKAVLLRFWLIDCPYCTRSAPALNEIHSRYADRGLLVIGIHHPKSERARDAEVVRHAARQFGFKFAVGSDDEWKTVRAYGVGTTFTDFTSTSFLIDKTGTIRWLHDGGEFHRGGGPGHERCNAAFESLQRELDALL
ncbi:MAG: redoxin domain-containing protein [Deltaproteobacteria bacterium]